MKAVLLEKPGPLAPLIYTTVKDPEVGSGQVRVKICAASVNRLDLWVRQGLPGIQIPLPHILGCDAAGVVEKVGSAVKDVKGGDSVVVSPGLSCGFCEFCTSGWDSLCRDFKILGFQVDGSYAEKVVVSHHKVIPVSRKYSFEQWASIPLVSLTAYHMLVTRAHLRAGEKVLVHAAGSGIGSIAIQLAKFLGAEVFTTVGDRQKILKAKRLGADHVILYREHDFAEVIKKKTNGQGVNVVFEHIGPDTWQKNILSLARGGRMVTCGATSGPSAPTDIRYLFMRQLSILGSYMGARFELLRVLELFEKGKLKPVVDSVFPLKDASKAHEKMHKRLLFGKIVLKP